MKRSNFPMHFKGKKWLGHFSLLLSFNFRSCSFFLPMHPLRFHSYCFRFFHPIHLHYEILLFLNSFKILYLNFLNYEVEAVRKKNSHNLRNLNVKFLYFKNLKLKMNVMKVKKTVWMNLEWMLRTKKKRKLDDRKSEKWPSNFFPLKCIENFGLFMTFEVA